MKLLGFTCVVVMLLVQQAAGQSCPSSTCNAAFGNALGGPIDCCKWDYNSKPTCSWGGTPVSWKQARTCSQDGKTYSVLIKSNFQGPPGGSPECKCSNPQEGSTLPTFSVLQACVNLKPRLDQDISGSDIPCNGGSFCQKCGGLEAVKNSCLGNNRCVAFTYEASTGCGYLKSSPGTSSRKGWVAYTRD